MTAPLHRVRSYEELDGAQGREVFFRPHRYRAADLLPLRAEVGVLSGGVDLVCQLLDVSQSGVAIEWPPDVGVSVGDHLSHVAARFDGFEAYAGEARVGSVREADSSMIVGLSFEGPLLPMDDVLELRAIRAFAGLAAPIPLWRTPGLDRFKVLVSELRLELEDWKERLDALEAQLPWHVLHGDAASPARSALIEQLRENFVVEAVRQSEEIDAALRSAPASQQQALKQFSRRHVHSFLMHSPCLHRMLQKPFGYPGDYEMMRFMYERHFEGATLFGKAVNLAFVSTAAARAVRHRKDLVKRWLAELIESRRNVGRPLRILSVAAGPAQELVELLAEMREPPPMQIVLFDQDKGALTYAFRRLKPAAPAPVQILYLHDSIKRLLRDSQIFASFGEFDAIYSAGLFDYLQGPTAVVLMRNLFARLAPGGRLVVGNMAPENPTRWIMEHHLDWQLIYRSRGELAEAARRAAPDARIRILEEETGVNPFVELARE
jgi:extracellular factor (EF) 3-hydroxypalmitic acid methyl ester biosynthesis protein